MRTRIIMLVIALSLFSIGCKRGNNDKQTTQPDQQLTGDISISGAWALEPLMNVWAAEFTKLNPELKISVIANGTGAGLKDLNEGKSQIAMVSRELLPDEEAAELWSVSVTKEGVLPIVNEAVPQWEKLKAEGITRDKLQRVFSGSISLTWGELTSTDDGTPVVCITRSDESGAELIWAKYLGISIDQLKGTEMPGDTGMIAEITKQKGGLGFCNAHYAYDQLNNKQTANLRVLPIDINKNVKIDDKENFYDNLENLHRAAYLGTFPSSLCRNLQLVMKAKPDDPNVKAFVEWILTDGQEIALKNGYCEIRKCEAKEALEKLK